MIGQPDLELVARKICTERQLQFVGRVGEGTFKQTFEVINAENLRVALKLYKATVAGPREKREIDAMLRCKHNNIARLLSVDPYGHEGTTLVTLTEEFLPGGTLTDKGQISRNECLRIGSCLVDAIAHIADLGLVHRDIKPDNIMFRQDRTTPVLTDFGVARDLFDSSLTPSWAPRGPGTPFFSSPEQLNNQKSLIDWRSDQFALGIVLAYVVIGAHPYRPREVADNTVVELVATRQGPTPQFVESCISSGLPVLVKMVAPWPVQRFRTAAQLATAWLSQSGVK